MKKNLFPILALILIACTPQVTVTSEVTVSLSPPPTDTPIPTPTSHPKFIELQNFIDDSSEKFILLPDGTIEELTADGTKQIIPNLQIDQNGVINIIFNNEHIVIEQSQIAFDDENGLTIEGYELDENDEWVEANNAEDMASTVLDQYSINPESVTITETDGVTRVTDNETGKVLFETDGEVSKFSLEFAVDTIAAASCEPTEFKPNSYGLRSGNSVEEQGKFNKYTDLVLNGSGLPGWTGMNFQYFLIDRAEQCWGWFYATDQNDANKDKVIIYRDVEGVVQVVPILDEITWDELYSFAGDR
ncbi:hypothetical protein MASR2M66_09900 [Chloroflexota bacterium]